VFEIRHALGSDRAGETEIEKLGGGNKLEEKF
jgi:hypothetical protein